MSSRRAFLLAISIAALCLVSGISAQNAPKIAISAVRIPTPEECTVQGSGFTPKSNVSSHLRKPDGSEYPVLPILTDDRGTFTHQIDTRLLAIGTHELWIVDESAKISSNLVRFEVTDKSPLK